MREENARRKLNKKLDALARDNEGGTGNGKSFHKATRALGKALIDSALEDMALEEAEAMEPCIMCGRNCVRMCCSTVCEREAVAIGLIQPEKLA